MPSIFLKGSGTGPKVLAKLAAVLGKAKASVDYQMRKMKFSRRLAALTLASSASPRPRESAACSHNTKFRSSGGIHSLAPAATRTGHQLRNLGC